MQQVQNQLDDVIRRMLFVPSTPDAAAEPALPTDDDATDAATRQAENAFSFALLFSGVRCIIMYVIMPFVLPIIGIAGTGATYLDIVINLVAIGAIIFSVRRFWQVDYKYKWQYLPVAIVALGLLVAFIALDFAAL